MVALFHTAGDTPKMEETQTQLSGSFWGNRGPARARTHALLPTLREDTVSAEYKVLKGHHSSTQVVRHA